MSDDCWSVDMRVVHAARFSACAARLQGCSVHRARRQPASAGARAAAPCSGPGCLRVCTGCTRRSATRPCEHDVAHAPAPRFILTHCCAAAAGSFGQPSIKFDVPEGLLIDEDSKSITKAEVRTGRSWGSGQQAAGSRACHELTLLACLAHRLCVLV